MDINALITRVTAELTPEKQAALMAGVMGCRSMEDVKGLIKMMDLGISEDELQELVKTGEGFLSSFMAKPETAPDLSALGGMLGSSDMIGEIAKNVDASDIEKIAGSFLKDFKF